jgi:hypothetical protein
LLEGNAQPRVADELRRLRRLVCGAAIGRTMRLSALRFPVIAGSESKRVVSYATKIRPLRFYLLRGLAKLGRKKMRRENGFAFHLSPVGRGRPPKEVG